MLKLKRKIKTIKTKRQTVEKGTIYATTTHPKESNMICPKCHKENKNNHIIIETKYNSLTNKTTTLSIKCSEHGILIDNH